MPKEINTELTSEQRKVMLEEATEPPGSSKLNYEKREGSYHCANCGIKLFESNAKFESGSGWPSFYEALPGVFGTKTDYLLGYARTEYHCKNCGAHPDIFLMMGQNQQAKDFAIMVFVLFLYQNNTLQ